MANSKLPTLPVSDINLTHNLQYGTQLTVTVTFSGFSVSLYVWFFHLLFILYKVTQIS
jgi:hypothetical protein